MKPTPLATSLDQTSKAVHNMTLAHDKLIESFSDLTAAAIISDEDRKGMILALEEIVDRYGMHSNSTIRKVRGILETIKEEPHA